MRRFRLMLPGLYLGLIALLGLPHSAKADILQTYDLAWSGASFGNTATATGTITLDLSTIMNPGLNIQDSTAFVTDFSITISGASSGNGTFGFSAFNGALALGGFLLDTGGATLDFSQPLIGQSTPGGPWGTTQDGTTGDFNVFSNFSQSEAPFGQIFFTPGTDAGLEDLILLTSFAPSGPSTVPEPSSAILMGTVWLLTTALVMRKRIARRHSPATPANL